MSLTRCPWCGHDLSSAEWELSVRDDLGTISTYCPGCGDPLEVEFEIDFTPMVQRQKAIDDRMSREAAAGVA